MVQEFTKKPIKIKAIQFTENSPVEHEQILDFTQGEAKYDFSADVDFPVWIIGTLEGEMKASLGDWIIKGVKGEFYPCKPDIFEATYELVV